jgi:hypothetical protein
MVRKVVAFLLVLAVMLSFVAAGLPTLEAFGACAHCCNAGQVRLLSTQVWDDSDWEDRDGDDWEMEEPPPLISFSDLPTSHWANDDIILLALTGVVNGFPDGTYRPEDQVTREQFSSDLFPGCPGTCSCRRGQRHARRRL